MPRSAVLQGQNCQVHVVLLYFDGCPNWIEMDERVRCALQTVGVSEECLTLESVQTIEDAERRSFRGSPTVLINGRDPFADPAAPVGLACRVYRTATGFAGAPTIDELTEAMLAGE